MLTEHEIAFETLECGNNVTLAYKAFHCYYRQYGNLNHSEQFMPCSPQELQVLIKTSIAIVNVSQAELVNYSNGAVLDQPNFAELIYVIILRGGFFTGQGLFLANLHTQFGNPELLTPETQQCVDAATAAWNGQRQKDLVHAYFVNCLRRITPWMQLIQDVATGLVRGSNAPCSTSCTTTSNTPSAVQPCYNVGN